MLSQVPAAGTKVRYPNDGRVFTTTGVSEATGLVGVGTLIEVAYGEETYRLRLDLTTLAS